MAVKDSVQDVLTRFAEAYAKKDLDGILALYDGGAATVLIGSGGDEWNVGPKRIRAQFRRDFSQASSARIKWGKPTIGSSGDSAWVSAKGTATVKAGGGTIKMAGRFTATLRRKGKKWHFVQTHFSMPLREQAAGESFPAREPPPMPEAMPTPKAEPGPMPATGG